jgi:hypothetical protein
MRQSGNVKNGTGLEIERMAQDRIEDRQFVSALCASGRDEDWLFKIIIWECENIKVINVKDLNCKNIDTNFCDTLKLNGLLPLVLKF